jgi:drug/metabolite transporter (DMT)-like permease
LTQEAIKTKYFYCAEAFETVIQVIMSAKPGLLFGALLSILSFFCLALTSALVKLLDGTVPIFQILFLQNVFGACLTIFICIWKKKGLSFYKSEHYGLIFFRAIIGLVAFLFLFIAIKYVSVTNATLLLNTSPLFIPFLLFFCFQERINHRLWAGIIPGFIGIGMILKPGSNLFQWQALLPIIPGICVALLYIVLRQLHFYKELMLRVLLYLFVCSALISLPMALYQWQSQPPAHWALLAFISISSFLSQSLVTLSLRYGSPSALAPLCYTSVIFSLMLDWFIWHHVPSWISLGGIVLVIAGGLMALYIETRRKA